METAFESNAISDGRVVLKNALTEKVSFGGVDYDIDVAEGDMGGYDVNISDGESSGFFHLQNRRFESPESVVDEIVKESGMSGKTPYQVARRLDDD